MISQPSEQYWRHVNLEITTVCNLTCPDCSAATNGRGQRKQHHHPLAYFENAAKWLYGTEIITVIGGEPTSHPQFAEIVPKLRRLFGCKKLILWTNGFKVEQYRDVIAEHFDVVHTSLYDEHTAPWNKRPNTKQVEFIQITFPSAVMSEKHTPWEKRGSGNICGRGVHGPFLYADGKFYGCCVAQAVEGGIGVTPSENWREELLKTSLPCRNCCFSPE